MKDKDINTLEHTSWRCQYHVVFATLSHCRLSVDTDIRILITKRKKLVQLDFCKSSNREINLKFS